MLSLREERMADHFVKRHVEGLPTAAVIHQFNQVDNGDPHDHPWSFTSFVLHGGYMEEVFDRETGASRLVSRTVGESFFVPATHIHRIVHLPEGECTTIILPGPHEQTSGFYQFRSDGMYHRFWHEPEFRLMAPASAA